MDTIFHEKQEGLLCAKHCLNNLLQGAYFTAVDLSTFAINLDEEERQRMAESGVDSEEYQRFLRQPSGNMDDSGYFSVQVISRALQVWDLEMVPLGSDDVRVRGREPSTLRAFILNYHDHWFTIRKLGGHWFNLNSLLNRPKRISDTYLSLYLAQLQAEGYCIFVICGDLPECPADDALRGAVFVEPHRIAAPSNSIMSSASDDELAKAVLLSLQEPDPEESELQRAMEMSLQLNHNDNLLVRASDADDDEAQLRKAIEMSLQCQS